MSQDIIEQLGLKPHPEGGYYRRTYESSDQTEIRGLERPMSTAIYFLLGSNDFAAWRRLKSDELMHYYSGATATVHILDESGEVEHKVLGPIMVEGAEPQVLVPAGSWSAIEVNCEKSYVLIGCTVSPGFVFEEFELADEKLAEEFSQYKNIILRLLHRDES